MRLRLASALFAAFLALCAPALATGPITGTASVHDGDTIRIGKTSIRIWGIDAVELKQTCLEDGAEVACGHMARDALAAIIGGRTVTCIAKGKSYKRVVGQCYVDGQDVAALMTRAGMAYDYARYSKHAYAADEALAREAAIGLWAMQAEEPSRWRACNLRPANKRPQDCAS